MYFDPQSKEKLEDLYNFEEPFKKLSSVLEAPKERSPLVVVKGLRRTGKTSLIKTTLNESGLPYILIDGRAFADVPVIKKRDLLRDIERALNELVENKKKLGEKLSSFLTGIDWIKVGSKPPFFHFKWRRPTRELDPLDLVHSFSRMAKKDGTKFVVVIDEAQEFKRLADYSLPSLLAHVYEHIDRVQVIVAGSYVGLLRNFLGEDNPKSPLYGKGTTEIWMKRLHPESSIDFLTKGFDQYGLSIDRETVNEAVNNLDGIIGWLTLFGHEIVSGTSKEDALVKTIEKGSGLGADELNRFLSTRKARKRYAEVLTATAQLGVARWGQMKKALELAEAGEVSDKVLYGLLKTLCDATFLEKRADGGYSIPDPVLARALKNGFVRR